MEWQGYISSDPETCHGKACIKGTRVLVTVILDCLADGMTVEAITESYPSVTAEGVQAALHYAADLASECIVPLVQ